MKIVKEENQGSAVVLTLSGPMMGGPETSTFKEDVSRIIQHGAKQIVVDLGRVKWINSSSIGILASSLRTVKAAGGEIRLARVGERVLSVFVATQLERIFRSYDSVGDAVSSFDLAVGEEMREDIAVLTLTGSLSGSRTSADLQDHLQEVIDAGITKIVLDIGGIRSVGGASVAVLTAVSRTARAKGGGVRLAAAGAETSAVLADGHLNDQLASYATVEEAAGSFRDS